jgi:hypothetical protein
MATRKDGRSPDDLTANLTATRIEDLAKKIGERLQDAFLSINVGGFERATELSIEVGRRIGQEGWTFPMAASPREVWDLAEAAKTEDIDTIFLPYYDGGGYADLKRGLLEMKAIDRWRPIVEQAFRVGDRSLGAERGAAIREARSESDATQRRAFEFQHVVFAEGHRWRVRTWHNLACHDLRRRGDARFGG